MFDGAEFSPEKYTRLESRVEEFKTVAPAHLRGFSENDDDNL
jgi:hypothetical protein